MQIPFRFGSCRHLYWKEALLPLCFFSHSWKRLWKAHLELNLGSPSLVENSGLLWFV